MSKQAIGYIRVSTIRQAEDGFSLEAQEQAIRRWCEYKGYELIALYKDEGLSAKEMKKRDGLNAALAVIKKDMALVCYNLDRVSRSTRDMANISDYINKKNANIVSLTQDIDTTTAMGKFFFIVTAALNELGSDRTGERVKMTMKYMKEKGMYTGGKTPYGFSRNDQNLVPIPQEQWVIQQARELREKGLSLPKIAIILRDNGYYDRKHKPFHPQAILRMVSK
jgi:site-specific DNA recombinase